MRNTLIHGYYAQAVYLDDAEDKTYYNGDGFFVINPHWLWSEVKELYFKLISEALDSKETAVRKNCLSYIEGLLK